jgi:hypothetical protein
MKTNFDPDSLNGKIFLNLIDKIIFGIIAAIAIAIFQSGWSSYEQGVNRRTVIWNSYSDSIVEQRKSLLLNLQKYLSLAKKYESSTGKIKDPEDKKRLDDLAINIELLTNIASVMNDAVLDNNKIEEASEPFLQSIYGLTGDLNSGFAPKPSVSEQTKNVIMQYKNLLKAMNDSASKTVK